MKMFYIKSGISPSSKSCYYMYLTVIIIIIAIIINCYYSYCQRCSICINIVDIITMNIQYHHYYLYHYLCQKRAHLYQNTYQRFCLIRYWKHWYFLSQCCAKCYMSGLFSSFTDNVSINSLFTLNWFTPICVSYDWSSANEVTITVTSYWTWLCFKSPASRLFTQALIQAQIKKRSKLSVTDLCEGNSSVTGEFPAQRASNAKNVSIWWRHHTMKDMGKIGGSRPQQNTAWG